MTNLKNGNEAYACRLCSYKCNTKEKITIHIKRHLLKTREPLQLLKCEYCDYECIRSTHMRSHKRTHNVKTYTCNIKLCSFMTASSIHMIKHKLTHRTLYKCHMCDFETYNRKNYSRHMNKDHDGEKKFACDTCSFKCHFEDVLTKHKTKCPKLLNTKRVAREKKFKNIRLEKVNEQLLECHDCGYKCSTKPLMVDHQKTHLVEKCYICDVCGYTVSAKENMITHQLQHMDECIMK